MTRTGMWNTKIGGFNSLAGKNHESRSTGALRDIKLHEPCSNPRIQWGGRREIRRLLFTPSGSLEQSIPKTTPTRICSPAMSQGASLEAGDKLGSQGQRGVPNLCHHLHPSSLRRSFAVREPDVVSSDRTTASGFCVPHCALTSPLPAQGSCHSGSFHPFYRGNQRQDQRRLLGKRLTGKGRNWRGDGEEETGAEQSEGLFFVLQPLAM